MLPVPSSSLQSTFFNRLVDSRNFALTEFSEVTYQLLT
jgi:hypothetical protein